MIINFSASVKDIELFYESENYRSGHPKLFWDFAHTGYRKEGILSANPEELDSDKSIYNVAINNYLDAASKRSNYKLNNRSIRSYVFRKLPIYWVSEISVKHPYYDLSLKLFFLRELLKEKKIEIKNGQKVFVILPSRHFFYKFNIEELIKDYKGEVIFQTVKPYEPTGVREFFMGLKRVYSEQLRIKKEAKHLLKFYDSNKKDVNYIFTYSPQTWKKKEQTDYILDGVSLLAKKEGYEYRYLPFFINTKDVPNWDYYWDRNYYNAFPTLATIYKMVFELGFIFKSLQFKQKENRVDNDLMVNDKLLRYEMGYLMWEHSSVLFNYVWHSNFFKSLKVKSNIFYQDEFHTYGRVISAALKGVDKRMLNGYGVQHGLLFNNHTVYKIRDQELASSTNLFNDGMPIPDKFIVWNNHFKSIFNSQNSLPNEYTIPAGNLNHYWLCEAYKALRTNKSAGSIRILWCTGLLKTATKELTILKESVTRAKVPVTVCVRQHPLHNIRKKLAENAALIPDNLKFEWSKVGNSLAEDFASVQFVYTTNSSGLVLDALACGKSVIAVLSEDYDLERIEAPNVAYTQVGENFSEVLIKQNINDVEIFSKNFEVDIDKWKEILSFQLISKN